MRGVGKTLTAVSAFARPDAHIVNATLHGAVVTCLGCLLAAILFISEVGHFIFAEPVNEMGASKERHALLDMHVDVTFPRLPCAIISLDMADSSGEQESDAMRGIQHMQIYKHRLNKKGGPAARRGYKAPDKPDVMMVVGNELVLDSRQHIKDMESEFVAGEGCHVQGTLQLQRITGILRITAHLKDFMLLKSTQKQLNEEVQKLMKFHKENPLAAPRAMHADFSTVNMTHHIHHLHFGPHYHGRRNALDAFDRVVDHDYGTFRYFVTVVPVTFLSSLWTKTRSYTYSVSEYFLPGTAHGGRGGGGDVNVEAMPALEFRLNMSPLEVTISYPARQIGHFLVRLCAVLGGCFALTRFADKIVDGVASMMHG